MEYIYAFFPQMSFHADETYLNWIERLSEEDYVVIEPCSLSRLQGGSFYSKAIKFLMRLH